MGITNIQWCHFTFNAWTGCTKVSAGCKNCYAETLMDHRYRKTKWGPQGLRVIKANSGWREPLKWDRDASQGICPRCRGGGVIDLGIKVKGKERFTQCPCLGINAGPRRDRVFCASLADVFEGPETMPADAWPNVQAARVRLFDLICRTPSLDWLLLTKRPENALQQMVDAGLYAVANPSLPCPQPNIWIGTSVEGPDVKHRIDALRQVPAVVRFLSMEPLIADPGELNLDGIHWVIIGGESGSGARPFNIEWARSIVGQCKAAGVACFVKQFGANVRGYNEYCWRCGRSDWGAIDYPVGRHPGFWNCNICGADSTRLRDPKGGNWNEWPEDLRVREFPEASNGN